MQSRRVRRARGLLALAAACVTIGAVCVAWNELLGHAREVVTAELLPSEERGGGRLQSPRELVSEARAMERRQQDSVEEKASVLVRNLLTSSFS